jgi:hypothetical protein
LQTVFNQQLRKMNRRSTFTRRSGFHRISQKAAVASSVFENE